MARAPDSRGPLLLGLLGLGGVGLLALLERAPRTPLGGALPAPGAAGEQSAARLVRVAPTAARAPEAIPGSLAAAAEDELPTPPSERPAQTERDFLARWRALAGAQPGALEAQAARVLAGAGPGVEKVALLRALVESGSPEAPRWLAHAVRTQPDTASAQARSVASYALDVLAREAARDAGARTLLCELAFAEPSLSPPLRRLAASAFARHCPEDELDLLRNALLAEPDLLLVQGALAGLAERDASPGLARLQLDFPAAALPEPAE